MKNQPSSNRNQTLSLISITLALCLITAFLAAAPSDGAQSLWDGAVQTLAKAFSGVFSPLLPPSPPKRVDSNAMPADQKDLHQGDGDPFQDRSGQRDSREASTEDAAQKLREQDLGNRPTPSPSIIATATSTLEDEATPTPIESTQTPTPEATITPTIKETPTPTPTLGGRHLVLDSIEVSPGESFSVALSCSDLMGVAGCDFEIAFDPTLLDLIGVEKTDSSDSFLMIVKKWENSYSISMAAVNGIPSGAGALLVFNGISSVSATQPASAPLVFSMAKMYDEESRSIPVSTQDGSVIIKTKEETEATAIAPSDPAPTVASDPEDPTEPFENPEPTSDSGEPIGPIETLPVDPLIPPVVVDIYPSDTPTGLTTATPTPSTVAEEPAAPIFAASLETDLTQDGVVDYRDLFEFLKYWKLSLNRK